MENKLTQSLQNAGFAIEVLGKAGKGNKGKKIVNITGNLAGSMAVLKGIDGEFEEISLYAKSSEDSFRGGSFQDLQDSINGKMPMMDFEAAAKKIKGSVSNKLQAVLEKTAPKRKRVFSDMSGNFDYSRRFEPDPLVKMTTVKAGLRKAIELEIDFSISAMVTAKEITEYGAFVWAVSTAIEKAGIQTGVTIINSCKSVDAEGKIDGNVAVRLKSPGQYLAPSFLAACFTANYFRRMTFALIHAQSATQDTQPSGGLGYPERKALVASEKGKLKMAHGVGPHMVESVITEVLKAIVG